MYKVFKYLLELADEQIIALPEDAEPLKVMVQNNVPYLWVRLKTTGDCPTVPWTFITHGTGHPIYNSEDLMYIDSYMIENGALVFHVFTR